MSEEITPAVSAEGWADVRAHEATLGTLRSYAGDDCTYEDYWTDPAHASMALGNAALADGHAGKITWADVDELRHALDLTSYLLDEDAAAVERTRALAAKLAALLPPRAEM